MRRADIQALLVSLRERELNSETPGMGSHQLNALWSLAYACGEAPKPFEVYRSPGAFVLPATDFFAAHPDEIREALRPRLSWELLRDHAVPKLALDAGMTDKDRKAHGYLGKVQYVDHGMRRWASVDVAAIRWFDGRERIREGLLTTKSDLEAKVGRNLARYKEAAAKAPSPNRLDKLRGYEKFMSELLPGRLARFEEQKSSDGRWLAKLDRTPDFAKSLFALTRQAENEVRAARGISAVGEAWVSETELLYRVRQMLPGFEVLAHGQPLWLGRQHLDIWIPSLNLGIEYHGIQHFRPVEFFGGQDAFDRGQERDRRKRGLCEAHGLRLIEIAYDRDVDDISLRGFFGIRT